MNATDRHDAAPDERLAVCGNESVGILRDKTGKQKYGDNDDVKTGGGIGELGGEFALIERIADEIRTRDEDLLVGIGDDAAVLRVSGDRRCVVTTDMLFEDVHFRLAWTDPYRLGWKAVAVNLSDIAAMGARPTFTFVSVALNAETPVSFVDELYRGMRDVCARHGAVIAGGDTNVSPQRLVINVTQMGEVGKRRVALRSRALPGDLILVTGSLGNAAAGLALLEAEGLPFAETIAPDAVSAQLQPEPRVREARAATAIPDAVSAMMDVSDGLLGDLRKLCRASGVGALIRRADVPVGAHARRAAEHLKADVEGWALRGGEDYELLLTVAPDRATAVSEAIAAATGTPVSVIGEVTADPEVVLLREDGTREPFRRGWDHFAAGSAAAGGPQ